MLEKQLSVGENICEIVYNTIMIQEINIETWESFKEKCNYLFSASRSKWMFRGQSCSSWALSSSIDRLKVSDRRNAERTMLEIVKRNTYHYKNVSGNLSDSFQRLSYLQHYGAPTRLVDVSTSPYVAAFFAMEKCANESCAIYAIDHSLILRDSINCLNERAKDFAELISILRGDIRKEEFFYPFFYERAQIPNVYTTLPYYLFDRLKSQMGGFLVQGDLGLSFEDNLKSLLEFSRTSNLVFKFILSFEMRLTALLDLQRMNISNETLFPGVEGFVRSLGLTYELERFNMDMEV